MGKARVEAGTTSSEDTATKAAWPIQTIKAENGKEGNHVQLCRLFTTQGCSAEEANRG